MATWLYQLGQKKWSPQNFRTEVWENRPWN
jgi:hypothetical protein